MAYFTAIQFAAYVGEAEARALAPPAVLTTPGYDAAKIDGAAARQSATLDSYFATRLAVPLDPVPDLVVVNAMILAREDLDRQGRDFVVKAADRVRAWAKDISKGTATLGVTAGGEEAPQAAPGGGGVLIEAPDRVFDDNGLAAYLR